MCALSRGTHGKASRGVLAGQTRPTDNSADDEGEALHACRRLRTPTAPAQPQHEPRRESAGDSNTRRRWSIQFEAKPFILLVLTAIVATRDFAVSLKCSRANFADGDDFNDSNGISF